MSMIGGTASPRIGPCLASALFCALVAAILGAVPGWTMCFAVWVVVSWLMLGCVVLVSAGVALCSMVGRRWPAVVSEARRMLGLVAVMVAIVPLGWLSTWVSFAEVRADLVARADASARAGGPRLAMASSEESSIDATGFVYDPDGVLAQPAAMRRAGWKSDPTLTALAGDCLSVSHLAGSYYRWRNACDGMF